MELADPFSTALDAAGLPCPDYEAGRSLRPLIAGRQPGIVGWRTETFTEFGCNLEWAARGPRYKLIERPGGDCALYDLKEDPGEFENRIRDPSLAGERERLRRQLLRHAMELLSRYPCGHPAKATHMAKGIYDYCARKIP